MKILSINTYSGRDGGGGTERTLHTLQSALQDRGHEVLRAAAAPGWKMTVENIAHIKTYNIPIANLYMPAPERKRNIAARAAWHMMDFYNPVMRWQLAKLLNHERPDVVTVHNLPGWSIAVLGAIRRRNIPMIQVLHDYYNICFNSQMRKSSENCNVQCRGCKILRAPNRFLTDQFDAVVGVSQYILDRHLACGTYLNVPIKKVVNNVRSPASLGLDEALALRTEAQKKRKGEFIRFGYIGHLASYKGVDLMLETFTALNDDKAELWIAGRGVPEYVAMLKSKFSNPRIRFLGQTAPKDFFTSIDVTILPSLWQENYPGSISESFAFGVPVIGSRRGGIPEMIIENENGFIFDPDQPDELLKLLNHFIRFPNEARRMGAQAYAGSSRFLDVERWTTCYTDIIASVLENSILAKTK